MYDQSKSSGKIRYGTISSFLEQFVKEDPEIGSGSQAVFVNTTKSQHAT